jgi:predicted site-specific integrase-resolvase
MARKTAQVGASDWLSAKETAAYLGRSVRQVRRYQADGKMPERKKRGRERRYPLSELEKIKSSLD